MKKFDKISTVDEYARKRDKEITLYDLHGTATVVHADGSLFHLKNVATEIHEGPKYGDTPSWWIVIFMEHGRPHVFHNEDLEICMVVGGNGPQDLLAEGVMD